MRKLLALILLLPTSAFATDWLVSSPPNDTNVRAAVNLASDGDRVILPAGTGNFTATVNVTKTLEIIGAGVGQTIINDQVPKVDPSPNVFKCTIASSQGLLRISGMTINGPGGGTLYTGSQGAISIDRVSTIPNFRIDNITFQNLMDRPIVFFGGAMGVIDHCTFTLFTFNAGGIDIRHSTWKGVGNYGNNSWAQPSNWGSSEAIVIEDCNFNNYSAATFVDGDAGMRVVVRKCVIFASEAGNHGTETGSNPGTPYRGGRTFEYYQNTVDGGPPGTVGGITNFRNWLLANRSGPMLVWGNTADRYERIMDMPLYRMWFPPAYWGYADGTNSWDQNHAGGPFATGTASIASSCAGNQCTMTVSGNPWTSNQWVGNSGNPVNYILRNTTRGTASYIRSNGTNTINYQTNTQGANMSFTAGDSFDIRALDIVLDQPGRGQSDLISGVPPINTVTGTASWPNNQLEMVRIWSNTIGPNWLVPGQRVTTTAMIQPGRDYCQSDDATCALPGYTPLVYPHPLVSGASPTPTPTPTATPTATPTPTATATPTPTATPNPGTPVLVQHVAGAMDRYGMTTLTFDLPNPALSGNCLILAGQFNSVGTLNSITDDRGNTWVAGPSATNATFSKKLVMYYVLNVAAGTKTIQVHFTGLVSPATPQFVVSEFTNIATSGALDGFASSSTSRTVGPITTTASNDLIYEWGAALSTTNSNGGAFNGTSITAGSGFTLLNADLQVGDAAQYQVLAAPGAVTPTFTASGTATWGALGIALKSAVAGTSPPAGIRIVHLQHTLLSAHRAQGRDNPIVMQFPSSGNLLVGLFNGARPFITGVTDASGNSWQFPTTCRKKDNNGDTSAQIVWAPNATTSSTLSGITVTIDTLGLGDNMFNLYDITGASTSPFDSCTLNQGNQPSFIGSTVMGTITPTTVSGLILHCDSIDFDALHTMEQPNPLSLNAGFDTFTNNNGHGTDVSTLDMDNGYAHYYNPDLSAVTFAFTPCCANIGIGWWSSVTAAFKASTVAPTPTPTPTATPSATPTATPTVTPTGTPTSPTPPPRGHKKHHGRPF